MGTVLPNTLPERDLKMIDFMVELWTNFAINHNPHESWPVSKDNSYIISKYCIIHRPVYDR